MMFYKRETDLRQSLSASCRAYHGDLYVDFYDIVSVFLSTSLSLAGNSGHLPGVKDSSHKSSTTHSHQCV